MKSLTKKRTQHLVNLLTGKIDYDYDENEFTQSVIDQFIKAISVAESTYDSGDWDIDYTGDFVQRIAEPYITFDLSDVFEGLEVDVQKDEDGDMCKYMIDGAEISVNDGCLLTDNIDLYNVIDVNAGVESIMNEYVEGYKEWAKEHNVAGSFDWQSKEWFNANNSIYIEFMAEPICGYCIIKETA
jgi:hypothetical protein